MTLTSFLAAYALTLPAMVVLDALWLGVLARRFYQRRLQGLLRPRMRIAPAAAFYLLYLVAVLVLAVEPAAARGSPAVAIRLGALLGLVAYAAYDLVNLATLEGFPLDVALVDMVWGAAVTAVTAGWGWWVAVHIA